MMRRHLLSIESLSVQAIEEILDASAKPIPRVHQGKTVATLFFEPSTRTRGSFDLAAKRLGCDVLSFDPSSSSAGKGEDLLDTVANLDAMQIDALILRHGGSGAADVVAKHVRASVINAGDGRHEHPTQALLDAFTIRKHKGRLRDLRVVLCGDIANSRVARSNIHLLGKYGNEIRLCAPATLMPRGIETLAPNVSTFTNFDEALEGADVVMMLRVQMERIDEALIASKKDYPVLYGLSDARLRLAKKDAIVMHPGPMNRGMEIASSVADGPQSVILDQVSNGVKVRAAVLDLLLRAKEAGA